MESWVNEQTCEKEGIIESSHILEHSSNRIYLSLVDIILLIKFEDLFVHYTLSSTLILISCEILIFRSWIENVYLLLVKQAEEIIIKLNGIFLDKGLVLHCSTRYQTHIHIIQEVMDRSIIIRWVKIWVNHYFLHTNLSKPFVEFLLCCTFWV